MRIEAPCLDCNEPVVVEMKDGKVIEKSPDTIMGYVAVPFSKWMDRIAFT